MRIEGRIAGSVAGICALSLLLIPGVSTAAPNGSLGLSVLSAKPEHVTGGDALVEVAVRGIDRTRVKVRVNGRNVTRAFSPRERGPGRMRGLVQGLRPGHNLVTAWGRGARRPAQLSLYDHPSTGPVFSGPHQMPFFCRTQAAGLGPATDENCSAPARVDYLYKIDGGGFQPLADPDGPVPANAERVTLPDGSRADFVVRRESGVIDRSIYRWAILAPNGDMDSGWNRRFIYGFGGGCDAGHQQGSRAPTAVLNDDQLSRGYAVLSGSLNVLGTACNDVLSAEAAAMLKEHVIERLGAPPVWTMGEGGSGGSIQVHSLAQNYPGIVDGIMPAASFPDISSPDYPDCGLLVDYFSTPTGEELTNDQRRSITGLARPDGCVGIAARADVVKPNEGCDETVVPPSAIFDPLTNPDGIRCTYWDSMVNVYGADAQGRALRTLDNVGVQYGLRALQEGEISVGEFLDLNEGIGGYDVNGEIVPERSVADEQALQVAYETGRVNFGASGIEDVPIIDVRNYVDESVNVHQYVNTYRTRARMDASGGHRNHVMFRAQGGQSVQAMRAEAFDLLEAWMNSIAADRSDRPQAQKVIADKPAGARDACWIDGQRVDGVAEIGDRNRCEATYPPHSLPVNRAGKPLDSLALKCALRPIDPGEYGSSLTAGQLERLETIFPQGVCDWSRPGVGESAFGGPWQEFGPQRTVAEQRRRIRVAFDVYGKRAKRKVRVNAQLRRCPATRFQPVVFEARVERRKGNRRIARGRWQSFARGTASGRRCNVRATYRSGRQEARPSWRRTRIRVKAHPLPGFEPAKSKVMVLRRR